MGRIIELPSVLIFLIVSIGFIGLSVAGLLIVRRFVPLPILREHNDVAGFIFAVLGVVYAVVLAFVAIAVWEDFESSRRAADGEAAHVVGLHRIMESFPEAHETSVNEAMVAYLTAVIEEEFSAMRANRTSPATEAALEELWASVQAVDPDGPREESWYDAAISALRDLTDSREVRLFESQQRIPEVLMVLILLGAAITIAYTYLYGVRNLYGQLLMTIALAGIIALVVTVVVLLDAPFHGDTSISTRAMEEALEIIEST